MSKRLISGFIRILLFYIVFGGLIWMIFYHSLNEHILTSLKWVFFIHVAFVCLGILLHFADYENDFDHDKIGKTIYTNLDRVFSEDKKKSIKRRKNDTKRNEKHKISKTNGKNK